MVRKGMRFSGHALTQAAATVVLLTLLCVVFLAGPHHQGDSPDAGAQGSFELDPREERNPTPGQTTLDELRTLPAYRGLQRSLVELDAARVAVPSATAMPGRPMTGDAATEYQRTLAQTRQALETLRSYTDPAEFQECLRDLFRRGLPVELAEDFSQARLCAACPKEVADSEEQEL